MACRDGGQEHVVTEWLGEELDSHRLHALDSHRYVAVAGDEDDPSWPGRWPTAATVLIQYSRLCRSYDLRGAKEVSLVSRRLKWECERNQ